jgi:serine/threonine-protein kinase
VLALGVLLNEMAPDRGPAPLRAVIARCLENDPARRYKTAGDVRAALEVVQVTQAPRPAGTSSSPRRSRRIMALAAAAVVLAAAVMTWRLWPSESVDVRSLAILPFENLENDERIDYLADGLTESLIRQTSRLPSIRVTSLHVVLNLRGKKVDVASVGRELHVESVVTGRMKQEGSRLLITAELTEVASGTRLWERSYDLAATDLLEAQDEIAAAILNDGLRMRLNDADRRRLVSHLTNNAEAYDLYLHAAYISRHPNEGAYENTLRMLTRAIELDPKFAEAYSEIAAIHAVMVTDGFERPSVGWPLVNTYVRKALEIDPNQFAAMAFEHAFAFFFAWDWDGAARARRRLLQSVPSEVNPRAFLAFMLELWALGRPGEALELARRVREHDPIGADVVMLEADYLARSGQFDAAAAVYERSIAIDGENADAWFGLAEAKYNLKKFDEASAAQQQALSMLGHDAAAKAFSLARGEDGYRRAFRVWLRTQLEIQQREAVDRYVSPLDFARVYAQLGDRARAFKYLDAAFDERSAGLVFLNVDQAWNAIRDDPRFLAAVRRVGLPVDKGR